MTKSKINKALNKALNKGAKKVLKKGTKKDDSSKDSLDWHKILWEAFQKIDSVIIKLLQVRRILEQLYNKEVTIPIFVFNLYVYMKDKLKVGIDMNSTEVVINDLFNKKKKRVDIKNISEYTYEEYKLMERLYVNLLN